MNYIHKVLEVNICSTTLQHRRHLLIAATLTKISGKVHVPVHGWLRCTNLEYQHNKNKFYQNISLPTSFHCR